MTVTRIKNKKVLILGLGREGESSFLFLRKQFPKKILGLADQLEFKELALKLQKIIKKDKKAKIHCGKDYLKALKSYDIIIKAAGLPLKEIKPYLKKRQIITSQTEIFFEECPGKIIGVTGTKGKSTTATLIYKVLKNGGLPVYLIGNIGKPALSYLDKAKKNQLFVYELSSHQLMGLKKSPHIAVFLNFYPEHLDYYQNFKEYFKAKQNITLYQRSNDYFIFNPEQKELKKLAKKSCAQKIPFVLKSPIKIKEKIGGCYTAKDYILLILNEKKEKVMKIEDVPLSGKFNLLNVMPAIIIGKIFSIPTEVIVKTIRNFKGLTHRLEFVGRFRGIKFYNDSLATVPEATIEALETLGRDVQTILLGGFDRGVSFKKLAEKVWQSDIKTIILFPESGIRIWQEILAQKRKKEKLARTFLVQNMKDAVKLAFQYTNQGKTCLLSPASPSFGLFKDYREKGNLFKRYIKYFGNQRTNLKKHFRKGKIVL